MHTVTSPADFFQSLARTPLPEHRPKVVLAWAQTLDGSVAWPDGSPLTISGESSLRFTHRLRAYCDGILVGIGAVRADDPALTVRHAPGEHPRPIVLDTHLRFPLTARLLAHPRSPWIFTGPHPDAEARQRLEGEGARVIPTSLAEGGRIDLREALAFLRGQGIATLMVEGGPTVHGAFLQGGWADWLVVTISPQLLGGLHALPPLAVHVAAIPRVLDWRVTPMGEDLLLWGRFSNEKKSLLPSQ